MASSSSSTSESSSDSDQDLVSRRRKRRRQLMRNLFLFPPMLTTLLHQRKREYILRNQEGSHEQIWKDYFADDCTYPDDYFRRRYRMRRELFLRILKEVEAYDEYFVQKKDCTGRFGLSSLQKITAAIRILAYGFSADHCDEYIKIGESTAVESLKHFCDVVIALYEEEYLRSPNEHDIARLLKEGEERGFHGMLGSLDCMHWEWKNCPTAWHGTHKGHHKNPTLILEAIASKDLWIWHAFFGMPGSHNDLNVLDHSPLFDAFIHGKMPQVNYKVNGHEYNMGYYLTDGIYPQWATMIQSIHKPKTEKEFLFAEKQEAARKDIERAFGVLQIRWAITQGPVRFWKKEDLCQIMKTCVILHNMIIEDERDIDVEDWRPPPDENISFPQDAQDTIFLIGQITDRLSRIRNRGTNSILRADLMEHLWKKFGDQIIRRSSVIS